MEALHANAFPTAVAELEQALATLPDDASVGERSEVLRCLAIAAGRSANFARAFAALEDWDGLCRSHELDRFELLKTRGNCLNMLGAEDQALAVYREAWQLVRGKSRPMEEAEITNNLGTIFEGRKEIEDAEHHFRLAERLHAAAGNERGLRMTRFNLGRCALHREDLVAARALFDDVLRAATAEGDQHHAAHAHQSIAEIAAREEDWETAHRLFERAANAFASTGEKRLLVQTRLNWIEKTLAGPEHPCLRARSLLGETVRTCRVFEWRHLEAAALELLGELHRKNGETAAAADALSSALSLQRKLFEEETKTQLRALRTLHATEIAFVEAENERARGNALEEALRQTETARERAIASDAAKTQVLRLLAHELRNPLGAICNCLELVDEVETAEDRSDLIRTAREVAHETIETLNKLLDAAAVESGRLTLKLHDIDLHYLVRSALEKIRPNAERKQQSIRFDHPEAQLWIRADPTRASIILDNLLSNAVKYSPPGAVIELSTNADGAFVATRVRDRGPGLTEAERNQLFRLFGRIGRARPTADERAVGLGLYLAQNLALLHKGRIEAESDGPGTGSTFTLYLPKAHPEAELPLAPPA